MKKNIFFHRLGHNHMTKFDRNFSKILVNFYPYGKTRGVGQKKCHAEGVGPGGTKRLGAGGKLKRGGHKLTRGAFCSASPPPPPRPPFR